MHNSVCAELYKDIVEHGLYFVHENADGARSWNDPDINHISTRKDVHMMPIGTRTYTNHEGESKKMGVKVMTNGECIAGHLGKKSRAGRKIEDAQVGPRGIENRESFQGMRREDIV